MKIRLILALVLIVAIALAYFFWSSRKHPFDFGGIESAIIYDVDPLMSGWESAGRSQYTLNRVEIDELFSGCERSRRSHFGYKGGSLMVLKLESGDEVRLALYYLGGFAFIRNGGMLYFCGESKKKSREFHSTVIRERFYPNRVR